MFAFIRYLILFVLVIFLNVMNRQNTSAALENQNLHQGALKTSAVKSSEYSREDLECIEPGTPCNESCDCCCQSAPGGFTCTANTTDGIKYCLSALPPPHKCPYASNPCAPIEAPCVEDCDCCQLDHKGEPHAVNCYQEQDSSKGYCYPHPHLIIDCFPPNPEPEPESKAQP